MRLTDIPDLTDEFVTVIDQLYPEKCPSPQDTERAIWMYAGARELVRKLILVREQQRKAALQNFDQRKTF